MILAPTNRRIIRPYDKPSFEHTQRYGLIKGHPLGPVGGLVAFWPFNGGAGRTVHDLSGNRLVGTLMANTHWVSGKSCSALSLDGTGDYVQVAHKPILTFTNAIIVIAWVKVTEFGTWRTIVSKGNEGGHEFWLGYTTSNKLDFKFNKDGGVNITAWTAITDSYWHQVAGVYDGTYIYVLLDGKLDSTPKVYNAIIPGIGTVNIGLTRYWGDNEFKGIIDNVSLYNRVSEFVSKIAQLYQEPFCMVQKKAAPVYFFVPTGVVVYQELNLAVIADASVAEIDAHQMMDIGKTVQVDANVSESDVHQIVETEKVVSSDASVSESDTQQMVDTGKEVSADASVSKTDTQQMIDTGKAVEAAASVSCIEIKVVFELNLTVTVAGSVVATDAHTMIETGKSVTAIASPAVIDTQAMAETELGVSAEGSVSCTDSMGLLAHIAAFMILRQCTS